MKETRFLKRSKKFALGIALALGCNVLSMGLMSNVEAAEYLAPITGNRSTDTVYVDAGIIRQKFVEYLWNDFCQNMVVLAPVFINFYL